MTPLYSYLCLDCDHVFDKIVSYPKRDELPVCPICNAREGVIRKVTAGISHYRQKGCKNK